MLALDIAFTIYIKFEDLASALRIALFLDNLQVNLHMVCKKSFSIIIIIIILPFLPFVSVDTFRCDEKIPNSM